MEELEALERASAWDGPPGGPWGGPAPWGPPPPGAWRDAPRRGEAAGAGSRPRFPQRRRAWAPGALAEAMMGMLAEDGPSLGARAVHYIHFSRVGLSHCSAYCWAHPSVKIWLKTELWPVSLAAAFASPSGAVSSWIAILLKYVQQQRAHSSRYPVMHTDACAVGRVTANNPVPAPAAALTSDIQQC